MKYEITPIKVRTIQKFEGVFLHGNDLLHLIRSLAEDQKPEIKFALLGMCEFIIEGIENNND